MNKNLCCRKAELSDLPRIMAVIEDAQRFLAECGVDQWQDGFPAEQDIREDIEERFSYVFEAGAELAAFVCLAVCGEPCYARPVSGAFLLPGAYGTVHRTAISSRFRGQGLSHLLFAVCEEKCRKLGIKNARVDTHENNLRMRHICAREGYSECAVVRIENGTLRVAFEKSLD